MLKKSKKNCVSFLSGLLEDVPEALEKIVICLRLLKKNNRDFLNSVGREGIVLFEKHG